MMTLPTHSDVLQRVRAHVSDPQLTRKTAGPAGAVDPTRPMPPKDCKPVQQRMTQQFAFLHDVPLFEGLTGSELGLITEDMTKRRFRAGDKIFEEGDPGEVLYLIESGQVRIYVHGSGKGLETSVFLCGRPGEIFGELAIVDGLPRSASATAMENTIVHTLSREAFQRHMRRAPQLALNFMKLLSVRVRYNTKQVKSLALTSVSSRLARLLLKLAQDYGVVETAGVRINTNLKQTDLASLIGATRESTNKVLSIFRREDLIRKDDGDIVVLDPELLRRKVQG